MLTFQKAAMAARAMAMQNNCPVFVIAVDQDHYVIDDLQPPHNMDYFLIDANGAYISKKEHQKNLSTEKVIPFLNYLERRFTMH